MCAAYILHIYVRTYNLYVFMCLRVQGLIINHGALPELRRLLAMKEYPEIQCHTAGTLRNLAAENQSQVLCVCVFMCACVCACACQCVDACVHACVRTCVCMHVCICIPMCVYVCMCVCMYSRQQKSFHLQPVQWNGRSRSLPVQLTFKIRLIAVQLPWDFRSRPFY